MVTQKKIIGKLPVFRGEYKQGTVYARLNMVTYLGSNFISDIDNNGAVPCVVKDNAFELSDGWSFFADTSESYLQKQTLEKVLLGTVTTNPASILD